MKITAHSHLIIRTLKLNKFLFTLFCSLVGFVLIMFRMTPTPNNGWGTTRLLLLPLYIGFTVYLISRNMTIKNSHVFIKEVELFENYINIMTSRKNIEKIPYSKFDKIEIDAFGMGKVFDGFFVKVNHKKLIIIPELFGVKNGIEIVGKFKLEDQKL